MFVMWGKKCRKGIRWAFNFREWKPSRDDWNLAVCCVQPEETNRIHKFAFAEDAKASMIGQLLMRKAVSESAGIPYDEVEFSRSETGKPYVCSHSEVLKNTNFNFNVSHHGSMCVLAAGQGLNLGVDIMKVEYRGFRSVPEYFDLMRRQFSHNEWEFITCPGLEIEQLSRFYRLWCLKESYVKAKGTGISYNLQALSFDCPTTKLCENALVTDTRLFVEGSLQLGWIFEESLLDQDHCVAVAIQKDLQGNSQSSGIDIHLESPTFSTLNYEELMKNAYSFVPLKDDFWENFSQKPEKPH